MSEQVASACLAKADKLDQARHAKGVKIRRRDSVRHKRADDRTKKRHLKAVVKRERKMNTGPSTKRTRERCVEKKSRTTKKLASQPERLEKKRLRLQKRQQKLENQVSKLLAEAKKAGELYKALTRQQKAENSEKTSNVVGAESRDLGVDEGSDPGSIASSLSTSDDSNKIAGYPTTPADDIILNRRRDSDAASTCDIATKSYGAVKPSAGVLGGSVKEENLYKLISGLAHMQPPERKNVRKKQKNKTTVTSPKGPHEDIYLSKPGHEQTLLDHGKTRVQTEGEEEDHVESSGRLFNGQRRRVESVEEKPKAESLVKRHRDSGQREHETKSKMDRQDDEREEKAVSEKKGKKNKIERKEKKTDKKKYEREKWEKREKREETERRNKKRDRCKAKRDMHEIPESSGINPKAADNWNVGDLEGGPARQSKFARLLGAGGPYANSTMKSSHKAQELSTSAMAEADIQRQFEVGVKMKVERSDGRRGLGAQTKF